MIVEQGCKKVVGHADRVKVASEVQIQLVHRHDLGITSAGGAALHTEARAKARFAQAYCGFLAFAIESVAETDRGGGLPFAGRRGIDGSDEDELSVRPVRKRAFDEIHPDLRFVMTERLNTA